MTEQKGTSSSIPSDSTGALSTTQSPSFDGEHTQVGLNAAGASSKIRRRLSLQPSNFSAIASNSSSRPQNISPRYHGLGNPSSKVRRRFSIDRINQVSFQATANYEGNEVRNQNIVQRPLTAIGGRETFVRTTANNNMPFGPSHHLVTNSMLKAMLDESEPERSRTTRRSSMDLFRTIPSHAEHIPRPSTLRRVSLDHVSAFFDPNAAMKRDLGVAEASEYTQIEQKISLEDSFTDDDNSMDDKLNDLAVKNTQMDLSPNSPHPAIEYPPLYFILKHFPRILNCMEKFYRIRWELKYPLQRPVFLSKKLRKIGIYVSWGECLIMLPFLLIFIRGLVTSFIYPSVSKSGIVARLPLIICFLTATHNSVLTFLIGIPFERAIRYHKISGYLAFLNGLFHTYVAWVAHKQEAEKDKVLDFASNDQVNMSGTLLLCIILSMILTASPYVRRKAFEVFYYFHIIFAMTMMGCAFYHSGVLVPIFASILWGGDLLFRKLYMARFRYPRKASILQLTDTVIEVRIPKTKGFDYNPGQVGEISSGSILISSLSKNTHSGFSHSLSRML